VISKANLRKPLPPPKDKEVEDYDKAYREWFDKKSDTERFHVFLLPKTRGIVFLFSSKDFENAELRVWPPNRDVGKDQALRATVRVFEGTVYAAIFGTPKDLPAPGEVDSNDEQQEKNLYTIKVRLPENFPPKLLRSARVAKDGCYYFKERIRFGIRNPAGEYEIVNADPISLEESMMVQFASLYADKIELARWHQNAFAVKAKEQEESKESEDKDSKKEEKPKLIPKELEPWSLSMAWAYDKAKMSVGLINEGRLHKRAKIIGDVIYNELGLDEYQAFRSVKASIDLLYGIEHVKDSWNKFVVETLYKNIISKATSTDWSKLKAGFEKVDWLEKLKLSKDSWVYEIQDLNGEQLTNFRELVVGKRREGLAKLAQGAKKITGRVDVGLSYYEVAKTSYELYRKNLQLSSVAEKLSEFCREYQKHFSDYPCREAMGMMEKYRANTVARKLEVEEIELQLMNQVIDAALGSLALIPVAGSAAGLILAVKKAGELVYDLYSMLEEAISDQFEQVQEDLGLTSSANMKLGYESIEGKEVSERGRDEMELQFRIRAEVLLSLVRLLLRAALDPECKNQEGNLVYEKYKEKLINQYMLEDFLQYFVFSDGWEYTVKPLVPISLDTFWHSIVGKHGGYKSREERRIALGFDEENQPKAVQEGEFPNAMLLFRYGVPGETLKEKNVVANFQKYFPIHYMSTEDAAKFAEAFELTYDAVKNKDIVYSRGYFRPKDFDPKSSTEKDYGWKPIQKDTVLSPLEQVRVLVVLDQKAPRKVYPISLQVCRIDPCPDLRGPVYKNFIGELGEDLLESEKGILDRQGQKIEPNRLGCVFYPFYHFGNLLLAGLKPFGDRNESYFIGKYQKNEMRYEFRVKAGGDDDFDEIEIGKGQKECKLSIDFDRDKLEKELIRTDYFVEKSEERNYIKLFSPPGNELEEESKKKLSELRQEKPALPIGMQGKWQTGSGGNKKYLEYANKYRSGVGPVLVRIKESNQDQGRFYLPGDPERKFTEREYFWDKPVEFYVLVWSTHIEKEAYQKARLDSGSVPIEVKLVNYEGWDNDGPTYSGRMYYYGVINPVAIRSEEDREFSRRSEMCKAFSNYMGEIFGGSSAISKMSTSMNQLDELLAGEYQSTTQGSEAEELCRRIDWLNKLEETEAKEVSLRDREYHLYVAPISLYYHKPKSNEKFLGLRPFGKKVPKGKYFRIGLKKVACPPGTMVRAEAITGPLGEYEFHFPAPVDYDSPHMPWMQSKDKSKGIPTPTQVTDWIEEKAKNKGPEDELISF
jgi:hypothetical protein